MLKNKEIVVSSRQDRFYKTFKHIQLKRRKKLYKKVVKYIRKKIKKNKTLFFSLYKKNRFSKTKPRKTFKPYLGNNPKSKSKRQKLGKNGVIHLLCNKRNIFCTLTDNKGQIKASVSTGILKVKGKKRRGFYYVPKTSQLLINYLFKIHYRKFLVYIKGNGPKKKKRILINSFLRIKKFKYRQLHNLAPRSHNGCRPPKLRRK